MKWSDGSPHRRRLRVLVRGPVQNKDLVPAPSPYLTTRWPAEAGEGRHLHGRWRFKDPYWVFVLLLTGPTGFGGQAHDSHVSALGGYAPPTPETVPPQVRLKEELDRKAREGKFDNWVNLLKSRPTGE